VPAAPDPARILGKDRAAITVHVASFLRRLWTRAILRRDEVATFAFELALIIERADARQAAPARRRRGGR
jgi:hypothetical protein